MPRSRSRSRPLGRSGLVTRPTTGCGPASSARKVGSANVPVPIITVRMADGTRRLAVREWTAGPRSGGRAVRRGRAVEPAFQGGQELLQVSVLRNLAALLGLAELPLEVLHRAAAGELAQRPHLVDEQHAVEVVDLVLPGPGTQVGGRHLDGLALEVVGPDLHRLCPAHLLVQAREAQAALLVLDRALALD